MTAKDICKRVSELSAPIAEEIGVSIWDVEFEKEGGQYMLTVSIDKDGVTDIDDCEKLSRALDPLLDAKEFDAMPSYTLCVSSAGLDRKLKKPEHFMAFIGHEVEVRFYKAIDGAKAVEGTLKAYENGNITIDDGTRITVYEPKDVAAVRLAVKF